ncbi:hypothetical protein [Burkholderia savannae]|uniref:hypothetical protein n=2 Tax=Burkholderia TaxID=32008 RepID=UPI000B0E764C|nr:hypothetical protein [Burkholderia savannae]
MVSRLRAPMPVMRDAGTGAASRGAKTLICNARIAALPAGDAASAAPKHRVANARRRPGGIVREMAGSVRRHVRQEAIPHGMTVSRRSSKQGQQ